MPAQTESRSADPGKQPFITAYGEAPLVTLTEFAEGSGTARAGVHVRVVRPRELAAAASGRSWPEAHWELFNVLLSEYMRLDGQRAHLEQRSAERLFLFEALKDDGTLALIASIARSGFPPGVTDGTAAPVGVGDQAR